MKIPVFLVVFIAVFEHVHSSGKLFVYII